MNPIHRLLRPCALLMGLPCLLLASGCILVHIEGEVLEDGWVLDLVQGDIAPEGFDSGDSEFRFLGSITGLDGKYELEFTCSPEDLPDYLDRLSVALEDKVIEERDAEILRRDEPDAWQRHFQYDGDDGRGEVRIRVEQLKPGSRYEYRLVIVWDEN